VPATPVSIVNKSGVRTNLATGHVTFLPYVNKHAGYDITSTVTSFAQKTNLEFKLLVNLVKSKNSLGGRA